MGRQFVVSLGAVVALSVGLRAAGLPWVWAYLLGINLVTLATYGYDKRQAARGGWRIGESVLHALTAIGGTPAALLGQWLFRHKTRPGRFRTTFVLVVVTQVALLALAVWRFGWST